MLWLLNSRAALGAQCWGSVCFPWGERGLQQDALIHEELSGFFGLYSTRERCLGLVLKSRPKARVVWGRVWVRVKQGAAVLRCLWEQGCSPWCHLCLQGRQTPEGLGRGLLRACFSLGQAGLHWLSNPVRFEGVSWGPLLAPVLSAALLGPRCLEAPGWSSASQRRFQI